MNSFDLWLSFIVIGGLIFIFCYVGYGFLHLLGLF